MDDAVPVTGDRLEGVVYVDGGIAIMLDLLHDGIGPAVDESVARKQQHREPVGVGKSCRRHHVGGARADR
jgi:hypothetical protein